MIKNTILAIVGLIGFSLLIGFSYDKPDKFSLVIGILGLASLLFAAVNFIQLLIKAWNEYGIKISTRLKK